MLKIVGYRVYLKYITGNFNIKKNCTILSLKNKV